MSLNDLMKTMLPVVEAEMQAVVAGANTPETTELHEMLTYHMGWTGEGSGPKAQGKRIRPFLVTLTTAAAGGNWQNAVPAAAAVELLHNFSLIHDDIEDNSDLRRGRPVVWKKWGLAQGINAGDALFTLSFLAMLRLEATTSTETAFEASRILQTTCLILTQGQYLDMSFETREQVTIDEYWTMIGGKTASLLAACTELGALVAGVDDEKRKAYRDFGRGLGLAFQVKDDLLGIWGDAELTGKSAESDLVERKKSLPVLYGLGQGGAFAERWAAGPIAPEDVPAVAQMLAEDGARAYTQDVADQLTSEAIHAMERAKPVGQAGEALVALANQLLGRSV
jgi:geranylgeranyl diphosphate synthase type I